MLHRPQKYERTLPREHRNTPWFGSQSREDEGLVVAVICVLSAFAIALMVL